MDRSGFSKIDLELLITPEIYERGLAYLRAGHLLETYRFGDILAGKIAGTAAVYKARLWLEDGWPRAECSCPYGGFCKHLTALALAWLETPERFRDLRPLLADLLEQPERAAQFLTRLASHDPVGFAAIWPELNPAAGFVESRALLNLVRTVFSYPQVTLEQSRQLWARLEHLTGQISARLRAGDPEALEPLLELVDGLSATLKTGRFPILAAGFREILQSTAALFPAMPAAAREQLGRRLLVYYCDPQLWEQQDALRAALLTYLSRDGRAAALMPELSDAAAADDLLRLIAIYELLAAAPPEPDYRELLERVTGRLAALEEGRFWLVDRLLETEPDRALGIARRGLRQAAAGPGRVAFRERLLRIHLERGEPRQAAALSFAQLRETPDFHEYLRLKTILAPLPEEWAAYWQRIGRLLLERHQLGLLLQCAAHKGDAALLAEHWPVLLSEPECQMTLAEELGGAFRAELAQFYPPLFRLLAERGELPAWQAALRLAGCYKKGCLAAGRDGDWQAFRAAAAAAYPGEPRLFKSKLFS